MAKSIIIDNIDVKGLNGRFNYDFKFHPDINLFTGDIGTGKTTLLKLLWFLTSGNLHRVIAEIPFQSLSITTSFFSLDMDKTDSDRVRFEFVKDENKTEYILNSKQSVNEALERVEEINKQIADTMESSLFFPTFRRIERHKGWDIIDVLVRGDRGILELSQALSEFAKELSVNNHRFITAVSTNDIIKLLSKIHSKIAKQNNQNEDEDQTIITRWEFLNDLVFDIIVEKRYSGIRITEDIILAENKDKNGEEPIPSQHLSSGEKQLLGFLCYNGFIDAKTIFIDEPELSLHPDWQRLIIDVLLYQQTEKQFFIASHSPFIGAKFEDKQFRLPKP